MWEGGVNQSSHEIMAETMDLPLEDLGRLSLEADEEVMVGPACVVFAKSEVITLIRGGADKRSILKGLNESIASRVYQARSGTSDPFICSPQTSAALTGVLGVIAAYRAYPPVLPQADV